MRFVNKRKITKKKINKKINSGFNKWLEILAGKELQTKLRKTENVDLKFRANKGTANMTAKANAVN